MGSPLQDKRLIMTHECYPRLNDNGEYRCMSGECRKRFIPMDDIAEWAEEVEQEDVRERK